MPLDPIKTTEAIRENYIRYLATTFYLYDDGLRGQFEAQLREDGNFVKGPLLESTPPFATGCSLRDLVQDGVLSPLFAEIGSPALPLCRPLYQHQEEAIRKAISQKRNLVIASGTGSGKTECFLVPILNHLLRQAQAGTLRPGVQALLLYPMNALANDQCKRLREVLAGFPKITFGRYTGETREGEGEAQSLYEKVFRRQPLRNELISREAMRKAPPHILITNYAMLEYLLLRPKDNVLFDGPHAGNWRFLVLDEAHIYGGARGIEIAMLLRRLKDRVVSSEAGRLQCMATSATLSSDRDSLPEVAEFATQLFGECFEWLPEDPTRQDVILGRRATEEPASGSIFTPDRQLYRKWSEVLGTAKRHDHLVERLEQVALHLQVPESVLLAARAQADTGGWEAYVYQVLRSDARLASLRRALGQKPRLVSELARELFGNTPESEQLLVDLVDLAARARQEGNPPLLPARYHLFVRALEGAYVAWDAGGPRLFLERREKADIAGRKHGVFEIATCPQCGALYLVGECRREDSRQFLLQPRMSDENGSSGLEFFLVEQKGSLVPDDEDEIVTAAEASTQEQEEMYRLCVICGAIDRANLMSPLCHCAVPEYLELVRVDSKNGVATHCPACGSRNPAGLLRRFLVGRDAAASVLATALYQNIPPRSQLVESEEDLAHDDWAVPAVSGRGRKRSSRQLLVFSDSRQDAAFFAPYLRQTYQQILRRRLIVDALCEHREEVKRWRWRLQDLVEPLARRIGELELVRDASPQQLRDEAWRWLMSELLAIDRRNSLESLGCLGFALARPGEWPIPKPLMERFGLDEEETWSVLEALLQSLRVKGAVTFPENLRPDDRIFRPRNREHYVREAGSNARKGLLSWRPAPGRANVRLDYLGRLYRRMSGQSLNREEGIGILQNLWRSTLNLSRLGNPHHYWNEVFASEVIRGEGPAYRLKHTCWELLVPGDERAQWYQCNTCHRLTTLNVKGVCPTYGCQGTLRSCDPVSVMAHNHYRQLYTNLQPCPMVVEEHTAQLTSERAAELQADFMRGLVNVLSCSTTFELGVDVGELESVYMRNVPPTAANYVQRAGRAGRRTDSAAFALTYAQLRPHDLAHFREPERMVCGLIRAPHFRIANEKIIRRHVHSVALGHFWRRHAQTFRDVAAFFCEESENAVDLLRSHLESRPESLRASLLRVVPEEMHKQLGLYDWSWVNGLLDEDEGTLALAEQRVLDDLAKLEASREALARAHKPSDHVLRVITTIKSTHIISFLASNNVLPKYGFPVDVVSLDILYHGGTARGLELQRDLRIALSEYAPSSQVVAGGKLWTSRYLRLIPGRTWRAYHYAVCDYCGRYQRVLADASEPPDTCCSCGQPLRRAREKGTFVIPEFGFRTERGRPEEPSEKRPTRTYTTRVYYSGEANCQSSCEFPFGRLKLKAEVASDGVLAVVNRGGGRGFKICSHCGYAVLGSDRVVRPHETPWGAQCNGTLEYRHLGHEFRTDVLLVNFVGYSAEELGFWLSLLYAFLEGASDALDIERDDIDGCLYPAERDPTRQTLVLFDAVPGGAGHVQRLGQEASLREALEAALQRLEACSCGGEAGDSSCYGCLRNYRNQYWHELLKRGPVIDFLRMGLR